MLRSEEIYVRYWKLHSSHRSGSVDWSFKDWKWNSYETTLSFNEFPLHLLLFTFIPFMLSIIIWNYEFITNIQISHSCVIFNYILNFYLCSYRKYPSIIYTKKVKKIIIIVYMFQCIIFKSKLNFSFFLRNNLQLKIKIYHYINYHKYKIKLYLKTI